MTVPRQMQPPVKWRSGRPSARLLTEESAAAPLHEVKVRVNLGKEIKDALRGWVV